MIDTNRLMKMIIEVSIWIMIWILLIIFFGSVNPLFIFDMDDWTNIAQFRAALPIWGAWNPIKVLPEILMPATGKLSVWFIMPIVGSYFEALSWGMSIVLSTVITVYIFLFSKFVSHWTDSFYVRMVLSVLFLLLHFIVFINYDDGSGFTEHFFYQFNATCIFNYTIPWLVNEICVFSLIISKYKSFDKKAYKYSLYLLMYLSVFSNLYTSIVLVSYLLAEMMICVIVQKKEGHSFIKEFPHIIKSFGYSKMIFIMLWLLSLGFELSGGRAKGFEQGINIFRRIKDTITFFFIAMERVNGVVRVAVIIAILSGVLISIISKKRDEENREYLQICVIIAMTLIFHVIYLIVLSSVVSPSYVGGTESIGAIYCWLFVLLFVSVLHVSKGRYTKSADLVFVLLIIVIGNKVIFGEQEYKNLSYNYRQSRLITEDIIDQYVYADRNLIKNPEIHVPLYDGSGWPLSYDKIGNRVSYTLYQHDIVNTYISASFVGDKEKNNQFGVPVP